MISIVIVTYKDEEYLLNCLKSLNQVALPHEIIVVDNAANKSLAKKLAHKPNVVYLKSPGNIGYGSAINFGAKRARGKYLFILNPDTKACSGTIETLVHFLDGHQEAAIAAPIQQDEKQRVYPLQGSEALTPLGGVFSLSFLNKYFQDLQFLRQFWLKDWDKVEPRAVGVVPGTAFLIRRVVFEKLGGFDPRIFIYFEEHDLCYRLSKLGWKAYIVPQSKIIHYWGGATPNHAINRQRMQISRWYYFDKHFGFLAALLVEIFARMGLVLQLFHAHRHSIGQK